MKNPFQSARLTYRAIEDTDKEFFHNLISNPYGLANAAPMLLRPVSHQFSEKMVKRGSEALLGVVICLLSETPEAHSSTDAPIGTLFLSSNLPDEQHHRNCNLGINILAEYQGKGFGGEAIRWALSWAFQMAGMHRVALKVYEWNEVARELYEKLGFVLEGRQRQALWFDGKWYDLLIYGLLEGEWQAKTEVVNLIE